MPALIAGIAGPDIPANGAERLVTAITRNASVRFPSIWRRDGIVLVRAELTPQPGPPQPSAGPAHWSKGAYAADLLSFAAQSGPVDAPQMLAPFLESGSFDGLERLSADFAFAAWNDTRRDLVLARDPIGVRPLFYLHRLGRHLAFASLVEILRDAGLVEARPDPMNVARYAVGDEETGDDTLWIGIRRVPAASLLCYRDGRVRVRRYWRLKVPLVPLREHQEGSHAARMRQLLQAAVTRRLRRGEDTASHLSGGLDSTTVAMLAARILARTGADVHGLGHVGPDRADVEVIDNRPYINAALQREPNLSFSPVGAVRVVDLISGGLVPGMMVPKGSADPFVRLDRAAGGSGPILSGQGGDEMVSASGRGAFVELAIRMRWRRLAQELLHAADRSGGTPSRLRVLLSEALMQAPAPLETAIRRLLNASPRSRPLARFLKPQARKMVRQEQGGLSCRHICRRKIESTYLQNALEWDAARAAQSGRSYAYPLLDRDLLQFVAQLPAEAFLSDGTRRALMRDATSDLLPESVRCRGDKLGSHPCLVLEAAEARDEILDCIARLRAVRGLPFDLDALEKAARDLPDASNRKSEVNRLAREGEFPDETPVAFIQVLLAARCLAEWAGQKDAPERP